MTSPTTTTTPTSTTATPDPAEAVRRAAEETAAEWRALLPVQGLLREMAESLGDRDDHRPLTEAHFEVLARALAAASRTVMYYRLVELQARVLEGAEPVRFLDL